jgi:hypothetical protein
MTDIVQALPPEELELRRKREEAELLATDLAQLELEVATLRAELAAFEARFIRIVGGVYAKTDAVIAAVARCRIESGPRDEELVAAALRAEERAAESAAATSRTGRVRERFEASPDLRRLFRDAARQMHPDLAVDEADRLTRHEAMSRANAAYQLGDADQLSRLLREWAQRPEAVPGEDAGAELVRIVRRIALLSQRIDEASRELMELRESELAQLKRRVEKAEAVGRDLLAEMRVDAEKRLASAQALLKELRDQEDSERR